MWANAISFSKSETTAQATSAPDCPASERSACRLHHCPPCAPGKLRPREGSVAQRIRAPFDWWRSAGQLRHALAHPLDPGGRNAVGISCIELWDHLPLEQPVESSASAASQAGSSPCSWPSPRPTRRSAYRLRPTSHPAREVDSAVDQHLHAARSARLPGPPGRVNPDVHPLHKVLRQSHVIVAEEDDVGANCWLPDKAYPLCRQLSIIDKGKIIAAGSPSELKQAIGHDTITLSLKDPQDPKLRMETKKILKGIQGVADVTDSNGSVVAYAENAGAVIADIVAALDRNNLRPVSLSMAAPTLDDVFLHHTGRRIRAEELGQKTSEPFLM